MTMTSSHAALLHVALQDLHAAKLLLRDRLPALAAAAHDLELRRLIDDDAARASEQAARLEAVATDLNGPKNLWMSGIMDDADRDARSHQPGPVLDVALVGAVRKAKAAEIVSNDTAIALAQAGEQDDILAAVRANRDEEIVTDRALRACLDALTA